MADPGQVLAAHALSVEWQRLSPDAQAAARTFVHDTLCVGVAGRNAPGADAVAALARRWGGAGHSPMLGRPGQTTSPAYAAFANAFQIHAQEYDCVHEGAVAHPLATVLAALIAAASVAPSSGRDFLCAVAAGVDVVATLGLAATGTLSFFRPATAGVFGSVAALSRLARLDLATAQCAFGHALSFASGTMQAHIEGKPTLAIQVGAAARSAIEAVDLATAGIAAPENAIAGPFGFLALFERASAIEAPLARLGKVEHITQVSWKPYPTGRAGHGAIVALQTMMRDHGVKEANLAEFVYRAPPLIARLVGRRPVVGCAVPYARLCFPYLGAVTLRYGTVALDSFAQDLRDDPALHRLAERFFVEDDGNPDPAAFVPAEAIARLTDGSTVRVPVTQQFGSPEWPLTREQHGDKARACLAFGGLGAAFDPLLAVLDRFESSPDAFQALAPAFG
jgi:2-methylcitrate dehydratase PrpD